MKRLIMLMAGSLFFVTACGKEDAGPGTISTTAPPSPDTLMEAIFNPAAGIIPFPNNILFSGSLDGTLNIPVVNPADPKEAPQVAMNTLDGFSTIAPISTGFAEALDATTIAAGVSLFEVGVSGPVKLTLGIHYAAIPSPSDATTLIIKPVIPLKPATNHVVVVSSALKSVSGKSASSSQVFTLLKSPVPLVNATGTSQIAGVANADAANLEALRQATLPVFAVANAAGVTTANIAVGWSFKTQTINKVLARIQTNSAMDIYATNAANFLSSATAPSVATGGLGTLDFYTFALVTAASGNTALLDGYTSPTGNVFANIGSVAIGTVNLPYYLDDNSVNPLGPVTGTFNIIDVYGTPQTKSVQTVPFLITTPNTVGPWPIVIFQHGFTVDKSAMFGIANALAQSGFATIAIDSVLHGDRTFGVDFATQDAYGSVTANVPDGVADSSGLHYLNLTSLLTSRDNIRQSVADIIHLTRLLEVQTMDVVDNVTGLPVLGGDGFVDLIVNPGAGAPVSFVGHSNGGILGTILSGVEPAIKTFVLANPGGDYASTLQGSLSFGPIVNAGLAANGVTVGSADYNAFFVAAQTVIDDGDPINYAALATATGKNILMLKTIDDAVVPNSQTDVLALAFGIPQVAATAATATAINELWPYGAQDGSAAQGGFAGSGFTFFTQGTHSSFLTPDPAGLVGLDVITEMQSETANYLGSALLGGATILIGATPLPSTNAASAVVQ